MGTIYADISSTIPSAATMSLVPWKAKGVIESSLSPTAVLNPAITEGFNVSAAPAGSGGFSSPGIAGALNAKSFTFCPVVMSAGLTGAVSLQSHISGLDVLSIDIVGIVRDSNSNILALCSVAGNASGGKKINSNLAGLGIFNSPMIAGRVYMIALIFATVNFFSRGTWRWIDKSIMTPVISDLSEMSPEIEGLSTIENEIEGIGEIVYG